MRILLIQNWQGHHGVSEQLVFPIGLSCLATALERAGHEPWIVHLDASDEPPWERLEREIHRFQPEVIGVSQRNIDSTTRKAPFVFHTELRQALATIRAAAPDVPVVLGGPGFTQAGRMMMERYGYDLGVQAEGEETFVELLAKLSSPQDVRGVYWRDQTGVVHYTGDPPMPAFSDLPYPKRSFLDWDLYRSAHRERGQILDLGIETTRGCPRRCAYCNYPKLNGTSLRSKPVDVVLDEIEYLQREFDVRQFTFTDSRFNEDPARARAICEGLIRRGVKARWIAWLGFRGVDADFLRLMNRAGCHRVSFSPDGLLAPSLARMRKDTTKQEILATVRAVRKVRGIRANWSFFATPPSTSHREQLEYLALYARIHGTTLARGRMTLTWCRVEEGTHFETIAREDGVLPPGVDLLPEDPALLDQLFYIAPGFEGWSQFWDRFLDLEMQSRIALGRATRPLRRFGMRDLTPAHKRGKPSA